MLKEKELWVECSLVEILMELLSIIPEKPYNMRSMVGIRKNRKLDFRQDRHLLPIRPMLQGILEEGLLVEFPFLMLTLMLILLVIMRM